ncbi:MAG: hypothetical protein AAGA60_13085 [Cyanobacteria bacterium P01_E01_bin.42]
MDFRAIAINEEIEQEISIWADVIIQEHKQSMYDGKHYLQWEKPWYSGGTDAWVDSTWWFETAKYRYEQLKNMGNIWLPNELEILSRYSPQEYKELARQYIDWWYERWHGHDPESWFELVLQVYPEHPLLTEDLPDYPPENYREWSILARIDNKEAIAVLRDEILEGIKDPEYFFWANSALEAVEHNLAAKIFSTEELEQVKQIEMEIAKKDIPTQNKGWNWEISDQQSILTSAVLLKWWDIVDAIVENQSYLNGFVESSLIPTDDILWWSLTSHKLLTQKFVVSFKSHSDINRFPSNSLALAIAWKRSIQKTNIL